MEINTNHLTFDAAAQLCDRIERYWKRLGYAGINTCVEAFRPADNDRTAYGVRSNIGPTGFPPKRRQ